MSTRSEWDASFLAECGGAADAACLLGMPSGYDDTLGRLAWHGHYWIRAFVTMAEHYRDTKYLDDAVAMIDYALAERDDARAARGELDITSEPYRKAPRFYLQNPDRVAPCWRRVIRKSNGSVLADCKTVEDGQITSAIMRFVALVHAQPAFAAYLPIAQNYLARVVETIAIWDDTYVLARSATVPGSYYWPSKDGSRLYSSAVPFNHSAALLTAAVLADAVRGTSEYATKADGVVAYWRLHLRIEPNGSCIWDYNPQKPTQGVEDFNHGHIDVGFLETAHAYGFAISDAEMICAALAFTRNVYIGGGALFDRIDGTSDSSVTDPRGAVAVDWLALRAFDPAALDAALDVYQSNFPAPTWAKTYLGWAALLTATGAP